MLLSYFKKFHKSIKLRRTQNRINTIKNENGSWAINSEEVIEAFLELYQSLLGSKSDTKSVEPTIIVKGQVLNAAQQEELSLIFTNAELKMLFSPFLMTSHQDWMGILAIFSSKVGT